MKKILFCLSLIVSIITSIITSSNVMAENGFHGEIYNEKNYEKEVSLHQYFSKVLKNNKWAILYHDTMYSPIIISEAIYDDVQWLDFYSHQFYSFKVSQNGKWGLFVYDRLASTVTTSEIDFDSIEKLNTYYGKMSQNGKYAVFCEMGPISKFKYDDVEILSWDNLLKVKLNSKLGIYDAYKKREVTRIQYDDFKVTSAGRTWSKRKYIIEGKRNGKWEKAYSYEQDIQITH